MIDYRLVDLNTVRSTCCRKRQKRRLSCRVRSRTHTHKHTRQPCSNITATSPKGASAAAHKIRRTLTPNGLQVHSPTGAHCWAAVRTPPAGRFPPFHFYAQLSSACGGAHFPARFWLTWSVPISDSSVTSKRENSGRLSLPLCVAAGSRPKEEDEEEAEAGGGGCGGEEFVHRHDSATPEARGERRRSSTHARRPTWLRVRSGIPQTETGARPKSPRDN